MEMSNNRLLKLIEMLEKNPNDTFLLYAMGMEHMGAQKLDDAEAYFRKVLAIEPDNIACHYQLAIILQKTNREGEAVKILDHGLHLAQKIGDHKTSNEFRSFMDELIYED